MMTSWQSFKVCSLFQITWGYCKIISAEEVPVFFQAFLFWCLCNFRTEVNTNESKTKVEPVLSLSCRATLGPSWQSWKTTLKVLHIYRCRPWHSRLQYFSVGIEANLISSYDVIKSSLPKFVVNISNWRELTPFCNLIFTSGDIYTVVAFFKASPEKLWFMQLNWKKYGK